MTSFNIKQDGQLFFTEGLAKKYEREFLIALDILTAERVGLTTAIKRFSIFFSALGRKKVKDMREFELDCSKASPVGVVPTLSLTTAMIREVSHKGVNYYQILFADQRGNYPWQRECSPAFVEQLFDVFTMDKILPIIDEVFSDSKMKLSEYIRWTSDCNGSFYRTCYCKKNRPIDNFYFGWNDADMLVISFFSETPYSPYAASFKEWKGVRLTNLKMQICPCVKENVIEKIEVNMGLGYLTYHVIDLKARKDVTSDYVVDPEPYTEE